MLVAASKHERPRRQQRKSDNGNGTGLLEKAFLGAVASQQSADSASTYVRQAHQRILEMLDVRLLGQYSHVQIGQLAKGASLFLREAAADGHVLSSKQLVRLFDFFAAAKNSEAADSVWQYATLTGIPLDITCYNAYLNALIFTDQNARALDIAKEIKARGLQPTAYTHACLIHLYGRSGDLEAARRQFGSACRSSQVPPGIGVEARQDAARPSQPYWYDAVDDMRLCGTNVYICNAMLEIYGANGMVDNMRLLFLQLLGLEGYAGDIDNVGQEAVREAVKARGLRPVARTFHVMIKWHAAYWDMESAVKYVRLMSRCGVPPAPKTLKLLVTKATVKRDVAECARIALLMGSEYGVEVPRTIVQMIEAAAQKQAEMDEMIRQAEQQHVSIFSGLSRPAGGDAPPSADT
ncbi:hypothetical protein LPJ61_000533 [Coemansia biformis]|uniref:Pentacotripeptide-repeat region of PRORP domain-containing protein n=1 Tax=Coemansia biformis TaxID=1286918 RepID=A0A9W8CYY5_9FUNG|nr:hypothetical protein LPJ61_000533 [Coemansia biformis]